MALSQIQCLDDNHVNPRTNESKPEFLYCEDQRLALEALLQDGREAFFKYVEARGLRGFLSDPELETLVGSMEPYDPGEELFLEDAEDDEPPLSLHYWPELSDMSIPQMDLGWPDTEAYRGVTRTTVHTQPSLDSQTHIKEIVRKMIAQAQKVIAVVMDAFTDVDIFRDLLDAGFKRRVSVYILLERTTLPHFLSMCQRANMHAGHLKHLRVRCTGGAEFYTRSSTKVRGRMGHRFMFVDGDRAVSGSYSFTWMSSRLDRNLVTVVSGQAVDAFDKLFRFLYMTSSLVDLRKIAMEPAPELEPIPQPVSVAPPSADVARKLYNPKYALALGSTSTNPSPTPSSGHNTPKKTQSQENSGIPDTKKRRRRRPSRESIQEAPHIHPGLLNLEKACMMSYIPIWPEPDPSSDVIGFINIRDTRKPTQVHLQRSEMFETSQAIRFSSPISVPKETLPEVATPRQITAKHEEMNKVQQEQDKPKAEVLVVDRAQPGAENSPSSGLKSESNKDKTLHSKDKVHSNTTTNQTAGHNITSGLTTHVPPQTSSKVSPPKAGRPSHTTQAVTTNKPKLDSIPGTNNKKGETHLNTKTAALYRTHTMESNNTQTSHQPQTPNIHTPTVNTYVPLSSTSAVCSQSVSSTSPSENNQVSTVTSKSSISPPLTSSSTTLSPPLPSSSSSLTSNPPIPKPRTIQLLIKTVPELQRKNGSKTGSHKENIVNNPQQKKSGTSPEAKNEEAMARHDDSAGTHLLTANIRDAQSDVLIAGSPKAVTLNIQKTIPKDAEPKTLTKDSTLSPKKDGVPTAQAGIKHSENTLTGCEFAKVPNENSTDVTQSKTHRTSTHEQRIPYYSLTPKDAGVIDTVDSSKAPRHTTDPCNSQMPKDIQSTQTSARDGQQDNLKFTATHCTDKHNTNTTFQELSPKEPPRTQTSRKSLHLHLSEAHMPDLRSPTPERDLWFLAALTRTPTPDGALPPLPAPDSRTQTPDPQSYTPDFRTPTSDISDGYGTPRAGSALSTASDEYYECSDCPAYEPVFDRAPYRNHGTTEDRVSLTHTNTRNETTATSPAYINHNTPGGTMFVTDRNTSSSETLSFSGPASVSSSTSSLLDKKVRIGKEQEMENIENGREVNEKGSETDMGTDRESLGTQRRGSVEAKRTADKFLQIWRKKAVNESPSERLVDGGVASGKLTNDGAEPKRLPTGDLKPKKLPIEGERPDKEKIVDRPALGPSGAERRPSETEGQKLLHIPHRIPRGQHQHDHGATPLSRSLKSSRPLSWARLSESRQLNQAEGKALHDSFPVSDNSSPRRPPSRAPPAVAVGAAGFAAGRKQAEVSHSQHSLTSQQPVGGQGRARVGQSPKHLDPKPHGSPPHTHSKALLQLQAHSQGQAASEEAHGLEDGKSPFGFTFSRLYNLKGLKDKMNKPAQSRRGSTSSPAQGHKSTN